MKINLFTEINANRYLHENNENIPDKYKSCSLHIALERSDINKDWVIFKELYKISPEYLRKHLNMTSSIFKYNYLKLPIEQQNELFKI